MHLQLLFDAQMIKKSTKPGQFQGISGPGTSSQLLMINYIWFKIKKIKLGAPEDSSQLHLVPSLPVFDNFLDVLGQFSYWEMYCVCRIVPTQTQLSDQAAGYKISHGTCDNHLFWFYSHQHSSG